ncbi:MAG: aminotransferase [Waddliaceae bacterium]|nr:aminotransferase [Waddliaceae bacterium]
MKYPEFKLENYLSKREFVAPFNFCASDLESHSMEKIIQMAGNEEKKLWNNLDLHYTETKGLAQLRQEIANIYHSSIQSEHILCFAGAEEGIYSMAHALLKPNDHAIIITPCYQSLEALPSSICETTNIALKYSEQWRIDLSRIENAIQKNTKLIVINFPHNPTGTLITHEQQKNLVALARKHNIWIFSDEVYRLLERDPNQRLPAIASIYEKGLSLSVMSKAYGLAGLRIGWIACQNEEALEKIAQVKHYLSICNSAPSEILSLMALRSKEKIFERNKQLMNRNLQLLELFFEEYSEWFEWVPPQGGCIAYPLFKGETSIDVIADELLNQKGVLILPSSIYDHSENHFRISFGRSSMPDALERFIEYIDQNKKKWKKSP